MITGLDLSKVVPYQLKSDEDNPTIWKLGIVPSYLFVKLMTDATADPIESQYKFLQVALKGWENLEGIEFKTESQKVHGRDMEVVPMALLDQLPINVISELALEAGNLNKIKDDERKN